MNHAALALKLAVKLNFSNSNFSDSIGSKLILITFCCCCYSVSEWSSKHQS